MNIYAVIPLLAAAIYISLLITLLAHRPWPRRHNYFALFLIGAIFWSLSDVLFRSSLFMDYKLLLARTTLIGFVFTLIPLSHFIETFHYGKRKLPWLALGYLSFLATIVFAALGYLPERVVSEADTYAEYNPLMLLSIIGIPFFIIAIRNAYYLQERIKVAENPVIHNQIAYLIVSLIILGISLSNVPSLGRQFPTAHSGNLVIAGIFAYAILKGQLIDFKLVARKGLVYVGLTLVLAAVYLLFLYLLHKLFAFQLSFRTLAIATAAAISMAIISYPIKNLLNRKVDELLYPKTYDYRRMLLDFSLKAGNVIKIEELRSEITKLAAAAVGVKQAYLLTPDTAGSDYTAPFTRTGDGQGVSLTLKVRRGSPLVEWLLRQGKPLFRQGLDYFPEFSDLQAEEIDGINKAEIEIFAPLINRGNMVGILALARKEPAAAYDMSDIDLISELTHGIAVAIENAQLHARIEKLAITDMVTEVYNRRHFDERLAEEISRHTRYGGGFALALLDLDRFKDYNDTYGHRVGDELLRQVAQSAKESVRSADLVFRYGGDEFALLLPETTAIEARLVCERLQTRVATRMQVQGTGLTLTLGIAAWPGDGATPGEIVRAADDALYQAKRSGGNRISLFSETRSQKESKETSFSDGKAALSAAEALMAAVDAKDHYTAPHSRLVANYATALAKVTPLASDKVPILEIAALLHDVGKIGIPDNLLGKEGKLMPEEWEVVKKHSELAGNIIGPVPSLAPCLPIVLHNHEWYNGRGYPRGLKGKEIPVEARILAIADAFASMTSSRPYRQAMSRDEAIEELKKCSGSQFDPELVELFIPLARSGVQGKPNRELKAG